MPISPTFLISISTSSLRSKLKTGVLSWGKSYWSALENPEADGNRWEAEKANYGMGNVS